VPDRLYYTDSDEANVLLAEEPVALLIGFVLDQQVPVQKAFSSPLELQRRLGTLEPARIAATDPAELDRIFREKPALHRFPGAMAERTQALCEALVHDYDGDAARIWNDAVDARDLERRLLALPGIGPMKARTLLAILGKQFGVKPAGWDEVAPQHPTLGDVRSAEDLAAYQAAKRARKAEMRAAKSS
jgi:uncharacterized HhH-GPD family protein